MKNEMKQIEKEMRRKNHDGVIGGKKRKPAKKRSFLAGLAVLFIAFLISKIVSRETIEHNLKIR